MANTQYWFYPTNITTFSKNLKRCLEFFLNVYSVWKWLENVLKLQ